MILKGNSNFLYVNEEQFRDELTFVSELFNSSLYLSGIFQNPYVYYTAVTKQLIPGTHLFDVKTTDNLGNESSVVSTSIVTNTLVLPPRFLSGTINGNQLTLNWIDSVNGPPDTYVIFNDSGTGTIDKSNPNSVPNVVGSINTYSVTLPDGDYKYTVDASLGGVVSNNYMVFNFTVPFSAQLPPVIVNPISLSDIDIGQLQIFGQNIDTGKLNVQFYWPFNIQAATFNLYHDNGTGIVDFGTAINFTRQKSFVQDFTTQQICFTAVDTTFKYVVRAVTSAGVEDGNTFTNEVILCGQKPTDPSIISIVN